MADDNFQTKEHIRKQSCNTKSKQLKEQMEMSKDFGIEISSDDIYFDKSYGSPSINTNTSASPNINKPIVINFFGAPGAGKSTGAAYVFSTLKMNGVNAELITEYAKDKTWEENHMALNNQMYLFGEQSYRMSRCADKVDVIVTDSPLLLNIIYNKDNRLPPSFNDVVEGVFNTYQNINYLVYPNKTYKRIGRSQTKAQAQEIGNDIISILKANDYDYKEITGDILGYQQVIKDIQKIIGFRNG